MCSEHIPSHSQVLPDPPPTPYPPNFMFFLFKLINLLINKNKTKFPNCNNKKTHKTYTDEERYNTRHLCVWSVATGEYCLSLFRVSIPSINS